MNFVHSVLFVTCILSDIYDDVSVADFDVFLFLYIMAPWCEIR